MTTARLVRQSLQDAPSYGAPDLAGEWVVEAELEDERGRYFSVSSYVGATAAITAAQMRRARDNTATDIAVYCPNCHTRCGFLGGYICPACMRAVAS